MKENRFSILLFFTAMIFSSCEEVVDIDLDDVEPALVVEALVSDDPEKTPYVKLTLSTTYFDNVEPEAIENALVVLTEDESVVDTLNEQEPGYYIAQKINVGKVNATYDLFIQTTDGTIYQASGKIDPVAPLDSLSVNYREETPFSYDDDGYYVTINFQEPGSTSDFYRLFFYLGGEQYDPEELIYANDELANGQYISNIEFSDFVVFPGDTVNVEMHSISEEYYDFLSAVDENQNAGDLFDTPPSNVEGNVSNGAFGFFATSAITQKTVIIQE